MWTKHDLDSIANMIIKHEGFRAQAYDDATGKAVLAPVGKLTIGFGFNIQAGIEHDVAMVILNYLIKRIIQRLNLLPFFDDLNLIRQAVLINMAYNIGIDGLLKFKRMLCALEDDDYHRAADEIMDSNAAKQLQSRYISLASMMRSGVGNL